MEEDCEKVSEPQALARACRWAVAAIPARLGRRGRGALEEAGYRVRPPERSRGRDVGMGR